MIITDNVAYLWWRSHIVDLSAGEVVLSSSSSCDKIRVTLSRKPLQEHCVVKNTQNYEWKLRWNRCVFKSCRKLVSSVQPHVQMPSYFWSEWIDRKSVENQYVCSVQPNTPHMRDGLPSSLVQQTILLHWCWGQIDIYQLGYGSTTTAFCAEQHVIGTGSNCMLWSVLMSPVTMLLCLFSDAGDIVLLSWVK